MHVDVNGTRLWFDVDGPALVPDGARMRQRPTVIVGRLEIIDEGGHFPWLDQPDRLWPVVTSFVTQGADERSGHRRHRERAQAGPGRRR
jgi:hypothetical protein